MEKRLFFSIFFGFLAVIFHRAKCLAEEYFMHEDGVDMPNFLITGIPSSFCAVDCAISGLGYVGYQVSHFEHDIWAFFKTL